MVSLNPVKQSFSVLSVTASTGTRNCHLMFTVYEESHLLPGSKPAAQSPVHFWCVIGGSLPAWPVFLRRRHRICPVAQSAAGRGEARMPPRMRHCRPLPPRQRAAVPARLPALPAECAPMQQVPASTLFLVQP